MKWYFKFSEFVTLYDESFVATPKITDKIVKNFMVPLNEIREELGQPIYIRSCYRPHYHEIKQGRDGTSQHIFQGEGACDVSLTPTPDKGALGWKKLFSLLDGRFNRITFYPMERFFHIDFKVKEKQYFIDKAGWEYVSREKLLEVIPD